MGLAKIEDYTKDNLVELYLFLEKEIARTKIGVNNSGFTKYSVVGSAVLKYNSDIKRILKYKNKKRFFNQLITETKINMDENL